MELFYSTDIEDGVCVLPAEESAHCIRVLRHREGDGICVIDGMGNMYECVIIDASVKGASARIEKTHRNWGSHPYELQMAVCPTKNIDRYEWFMEKAAEMGVDTIVPVIGEHSERKVVKGERLERILLSAAKQSLKAAVPVLSDPVSVRDFVAGKSGSDDLKLIAYCFEGGEKRVSVKEVLNSFEGTRICILIGPEGDFSPSEVQEALKAGFVPVHLGDSRLRTETAAVFAVASVYGRYMK